VSLRMIDVAKAACSYSDTLAEPCARAGLVDLRLRHRCWALAVCQTSIDQRLSSITRVLRSGGHSDELATIALAGASPCDRVAPYLPSSGTRWSPGRDHIIYAHLGGQGLGEQEDVRSAVKRARCEQPTAEFRRPSQRRRQRWRSTDRGCKSDGDASGRVPGGLRRALIPFGVAVESATINVIATLLTTR
jgi:hypothetical protein